MSAEFIYGENAAPYYPNVSISIERITPAIAEMMLEHNTSNRDPKREPIDRALKNGEWYLNGATLVFAADGTLLDGQNRLMACVKTGIAFDTIVVRGIADDAQLTMDMGVKRSVADYLKMHGYKQYTTVGTIGYALARKDRWGIESGINRANGFSMTTMEVCKFIDGSYDSRILPIVGQSRNINEKFMGLSTQTVGVLLDSFRMASRDDYECFIAQMLNRAPRCSAVALLCERLEANAQSNTGRLPQKTLAALIIKAWNAYMRGDDIKQLKFTQGGAHPEKFPDIYLGDDAA